jgi:hypothetical protein
VRRLLSVLLLSILLIGLCVFGFAFYLLDHFLDGAPDEKVFVTRTTEIISPDAAWKAYVDETFYESGFSPLSQVVDTEVRRVMHSSTGTA